MTGNKNICIQSVFMVLISLLMCPLKAQQHASSPLDNASGYPLFRKKIQLIYIFILWWKLMKDKITPLAFFKGLLNAFYCYFSILPPFLHLFLSSVRE